MRTSESAVLSYYAVIGYWGLILGFITKIPIAFWSLVGLMIIDIGTGIGAAYVTSTISSKASVRGLVKKTMILMLIMASVIAANVLPERYHFPAGSIISSMFCLHEFISILENTKRAGVNHPKFLKDLVERLGRTDRTK